MSLVPDERPMGEMSDSKEQDPRKTLSLGIKGKLTLGKHADSGQVRQSFSHGRSKTVQVEVKRKRHVERGPAAGPVEAPAAPRRGGGPRSSSPRAAKGAELTETLTKAEREARERALRTALEDGARRTPVPSVSEAPVE